MDGIDEVWAGSAADVLVNDGDSRESPLKGGRPVSSNLEATPISTGQALVHGLTARLLPGRGTARTDDGVRLRHGGLQSQSGHGRAMPKS